MIPIHSHISDICTSLFRLISYIRLIVLYREIFEPIPVCMSCRILYYQNTLDNQNEGKLGCRQQLNMVCVEDSYISTISFSPNRTILQMASIYLSRTILLPILDSYILRSCRMTFAFHDRRHIPYVSLLYLHKLHDNYVAFHYYNANRIALYYL